MQMTTYTIKGKQYTDFDINKRCAELIGFKTEIFNNVLYIEDVIIASSMSSSGSYISHIAYNPCTNPQDTWPIIERVFDELMLTHIDDGDYAPKWEMLIEKHKCTKLVAACICLIELIEANK